MKLLSTLVIAVGFLVSGGTAQAELNSYVKCQLAEGKTFADVLEVMVDWRVATDAAGFSGYRTIVAAPKAEGAEEGEFIWGGPMPSKERLEAANEWYYNSDAGKTWQTRFEEVSTCKQPQTWNVVKSEEP